MPGEENTVLLISSQKSLGEKLRFLLDDEAFSHFDLEVCASGIAGLDAIYGNPPQIIIVDGMLGDMSALQLCRVLKNDPAICKLPLMLITRSGVDEYQRFTELSLVADSFVEEKMLETDFCDQFKLLMTLFNGLDPVEHQQLRLLRQTPIKVSALNRLVQLCDQSITETALMQGFRRLFDHIPHKNVLLQLLFPLLETLIDFDVAGVFFNDKNREPRLMTYHIPHRNLVKEEQLIQWTHDILTGLKNQSQDQTPFHQIRHEVLSSDHLPVGKSVNPKFQSLFPFYVDTQLAGVFVLFNRQEVNYELLFPFQAILQEVGALMRLRYYYTESQMLNISEAMTGLYTHAHFVWCLEREIRQAKRHKSSLTLGLMNISNFRDLNQSKGFHIGDQVIKHVATTALNQLRITDMMTRISGGKMVVLFANTTPDLAFSALERMKHSIDTTPFIVDQKQVTFVLHIGLVSLDDGVDSASALLQQAENAMELHRSHPSFETEISDSLTP